MNDEELEIILVRNFHYFVLHGTNYRTRKYWAGQFVHMWQ